MPGKNGANGSQELVIGVPDQIHSILLAEIGHCKGLDVRRKRKSKTKVYISCRNGEVEGFLRTASRAGNILQVLQLDAVARAMESVGETPSKDFVEMVKAARSQLGIDGDDTAQTVER